MVNFDAEQRRLLSVKGEALPFALVERAAQERTVKGEQRRHSLGIPQLQNWGSDKDRKCG